MAANTSCNLIFRRLKKEDPEIPGQPEPERQQEPASPGKEREIWMLGCFCEAPEGIKPVMKDWGQDDLF